MRRSRGLSLGVVMVCLVVLALILFSAVSATLNHLQAVSRIESTEHARNLAEAALAETIALLAENEFKPLPEGRVEVSVAGLQDAEGIVTFLSSEFPDDYSTYRLLDPNREISPIGARGRTVPENSVHLVARGRVGEVEQWVECIYHGPPFPEGLIASGPVEASGLYLTGVALGSAYQGGDPSAIEPAQKLPANLFSGSAGNSVHLAGSSYVNGSVGAAGAILVDPGSNVAGEILPQSAPKEIPELDLAAKMDTLTRTAYPVENNGGDVTLVDGWFAHSPRPLSVSGDLDLNGSVLCVEGALDVSGAITGTGFVLVDGDVTVADGGSDVTGSDQIALAASGDIVLKARSPEGDYFKGLIYSEGDVETRDITEEGALVVNGKRGKAGSDKFDNVRMVPDPAGVSLNLRGPHGFVKENTGLGSISTANERTWGYSLALRRDPESANHFLVDFDIYLSNAAPTKKQKRNGFQEHEPKTWPRDDGNPGNAPALVISEKKFRFDPTDPDATKELADKLVEGLVDASAPGTNADYTRNLEGWIRDALREGLVVLVDSEQDEFELTFNLNNLLSEHTSRSRVLLWREWKRY